MELVEALYDIVLNSFGTYCIGEAPVKTKGI